MHGRIKTTEQKAKAIRSSAEKLIKKAHKEGNLAKKLLSMELNPEAMEKVMTQIAPQFRARSGGYTRMVKLGRRFNDDASMVVMEWVEEIKQAERVKQEKQTVVKAKPAAKKTKKKAQPKAGKK